MFNPSWVGQCGGAAWKPTLSATCQIGQSPVFFAGSFWGSTERVFCVPKKTERVSLLVKKHGSHLFGPETNSLRCATTPQKLVFFRAEVGGEVITVGHWDCYHLSNKQLTKDVFGLGAFFLAAFLSKLHGVATIRKIMVKSTLPKQVASIYSNPSSHPTS